MNVRFVDPRQVLQCVAERLRTSKVVSTEADIAFHDHLLGVNGGGDGVEINTSMFLRDLGRAETGQEDLYRILQIEEREPDSLLFCLCNGTGFSTFLEVSYTTRLMNNDVGPDLHFTSGASFTMEQPPRIAGLDKVVELVKEADYHGELVIGLKRNETEFQPDICSLSFGHGGVLFAMYLESMKGGADEAIAFMGGRVEELEVHDTFCLSVLLSIEEERPLVIPEASKKHVWRIFGPTGAAAFYVAHANRNEAEEGLSQVGVARKRLYRNVSSIVRTEGALRYRTDGGFNRTFVLSQKRYDEAQRRS